MANDVRITISYAEDWWPPFIFSIHGDITVFHLGEIEKIVDENQSDYFKDGMGEYTFDCHWSKVHPDDGVPYWDLRQVSFKAMPAEDFEAPK